MSLPVDRPRAALGGPSWILFALLGCACVSMDGETDAPWGAPRTLAFDQTSRPWIGPHLRACRLQDWTLEAGRVVCQETGARFPLRTAMVLDRRLDPGGAHDGRAVRLELRTGWEGAYEGDAPPGPPAPVDGWRGFLLGAADGGPLSDLVHHRPARDGGLLAVVDGFGRLAFFDMGADASVGGSWSVGGPLREGELPVVPAAVSGPATAPTTAQPEREVLLSIQLLRAADGWTLEAQARRPDGELLSQARLTGLAGDAWSGGLGLVSHGAAPSGGPFWFDDLTTSGDRALGRRVDAGAGDTVQFVQYTVSDDVLRLTAQFPPLGPEDPGQASLWSVSHERTGAIPPEPQHDVPELLATAPLVPDAWTATFEVAPWRPDGDVRLSVQHERRTGPGTTAWSAYEVHVPAAPPPGTPLRIASLNCTKHYTGGLQWNDRALWYPHRETALGVAAADPDLLLFTGDQLYEGDLDPVDARDEDTLILDYLTKWFRFGRSFGELTRRVPAITIPDDHDVYHGNLWGAGGKRALADERAGLSAQDSGGYKHGPRFVNVVHRTQTGHLPRPVDPAPVEQGISVYFTEVRYAGLDLAVLSDRQFKSSASVAVPEGRVVNGWFTAKGYDPKDADVPGAQLLGPRQEAFLDDWALDWSGGTWAKLVVSQTPFVNVATLPEQAAGGSVLPSLPIPEPGSYPEGYRFAADTDSGGWPQTPRDRAVSALARGLAVHLAGDQHLGTLVEYGVDAHRDGGFAFTSPAVANTWPRRWWPAVWGERREPDAPHYTGDFVDGFGNRLTVWAAANPVQRGLEPAALHDRAPGFGLVDLDPVSRRITFHCWPRGAAPSAARGEGAGRAPAPSLVGDEPLAQYAGWPRTIHQLDNGPEPAGWLELEVPGCDRPVFTVRPDAGDVLYVWRAPRSRARLPVPHAGPWTVQAWDEPRDRMHTVMGLTSDGAPAVLTVDGAPP